VVPVGRFRGQQRHALLAPILVEDTIRKIEAASAQFFAADGSIPHGNHKKIDEWEKEHKIKLRWNNWFDVSLSPLFHFLRLDSASRL